MLDPRHAVIAARLEGVKRLVAVTGGKGGIGKSFIASTLALVLARAGRRVGLLDLDFTSPSCHVILGFGTGFPNETFGIDPIDHHGIQCLSIANFAGETPAPMRGNDVTNALLELLAITRWPDLDVLLIDMPPGLGDATLDAIRLLGRAEYVVVAGSSRVVLSSVRRNVRLLQDLERPVIGVVENMRRGEDAAVVALASDLGLSYLGTLPYDDAVEDALGDVDRLGATSAVAAVHDSLLPLFPLEDR